MTLSIPRRAVWWAPTPLLLLIAARRGGGSLWSGSSKAEDRLFPGSAGAVTAATSLNRTMTSFVMIVLVMSFNNRLLCLCKTCLCFFVYGPGRAGPGRNTSS